MLQGQKQHIQSEEAEKDWGHDDSGYITATRERVQDGDCEAQKLKSNAPKGSSEQLYLYN